MANHLFLRSETKTGSTSTTSIHITLQNYRTEPKALFFRNVMIIFVGNPKFLNNIQIININMSEFCHFIGYKVN